MSTAIKAICWEYWQENRWRFFIFLTTIVGFCAFLRKGPEFMAEFDHLSFPFFAWFEMAGICWLFCAGQYSQSKGRLGFHRHLYIKPLATRTLVVTRLMLMLCTATLIHLLAVLLFYSLAQVQLPITMPIFALMTLTLCTQAIAWALSGTPGTQFITTVVTTALLIWWYLEHIPLTGGLSLKANLINTLWLVPIWMLAAVSCFFGVKMDRKNQRLSFAKVWDIAISFLCLLFPGRNARLITPKGAQFWILWRTRGWIAPCLNLLGIAVAIVFCLFLPTTPDEFRRQFLTSLIMLNLYAVPPIAAIIIAQQGSKTAGLASYVSVRPLTNTSLLLNYLKACLASLVAGWCIFLTGTGIIEIGQSIAGRESIASEVFKTFFGTASSTSGKDIAYVLISYSLYLWTSTGLSSSLILTGRKWPFLCVCALFMSFIIANVVIPQVLGSKVTEFINTMFPWLFSMSCVGGTICAFVAARKREYIHRVMPWCALVLFCVFLLHQCSWEQLMKQPSMFVSVGGQLSLIFLPLAAAPLAIAWNRHR